jgi:hypothetical protein
MHRDMEIVNIRDFSFRMPTRGTRHLFANSATLFCLLALSGCNEAAVDATAKMTHNFNGDYELTSYVAKPKGEIGQAEQLAKGQYGALVSDIRSPQTMFMCLWRNPNGGKLRSHRPTEIFLSCSFATSPVENPESLLEMAKLYNTIDRANLKANWKLENGSYRLTRFEVEIQADGKSYRSQNLEDNMSEIRVEQNDMVFPQNANDPFHFTLSSALPFRQNKSDKQSDPIALVSFSGVAEAIPNWVNY